MTSIKEKQVEKLLDRIIGGGDDALRIITKLALMGKEMTPEAIETLQVLKKQNEDDAMALNNELNLTIDPSGNVIPVKALVEEINTIVDTDNNIPHRLPVGNT